MQTQQRMLKELVKAKVEGDNDIVNVEDLEFKDVEEDKGPDPYALEDVPGIGPVSQKALAKAGFYTTFQIVCKNPTWLKEVCNMDRNKANESFAYMKKKLIDAGLLNKQEFSAKTLLEERKKIPRLSTGSKKIDALLDGGLESGMITMLYGEEGAGKTQNSHNWVVQCLRPQSEGGFAEEGKELPNVLYIDTENTFRPERIVSILSGKKMIPSSIPTKLQKKLTDNKILLKEELKELQDAKDAMEKDSGDFLDHIIVQKASDATQQMALIQNAVASIYPMNIKLVVIDSGTALFRNAYLGRGNMKTRIDLMNEMVTDCKALAENCHVPVIFVNQIYNAPEEQYGLDPDKPYGGHIIGHSIPYFLKVMKSGATHRKMRVVKSPKDDQSDCKFDIVAGGIADVP